MTQKEQARLQVLNSLLAEHMTLDQAATLMGVSARHTGRILVAYRKEGAAALAHGNRGLRSTNATPEPLRSEVLRLAQTRYPDANHTHLSELLREREGIEIGRTTGDYALDSDWRVSRGLHLSLTASMSPQGAVTRTGCFCLSTITC